MLGSSEAASFGPRATLYSTAVTELSSLVKKHGFQPVSTFAAIDCEPQLPENLGVSVRLSMLNITVEQAVSAHPIFECEMCHEDVMSLSEVAAT